jgi:hypothetical protein
VFLQVFLSKYVSLSVEALDTNNKHPSRSKSFTFGTKGATSATSNNSNNNKTSFSLLSPLKSKLNDLNDKIDSDIVRISQSVKDSPRTLLGPVKNKIDDLNIKVDTDILKLSESVKRVKGWKENFKSGSDIQTVVRRRRPLNSHSYLELYVRGGYDPTSTRTNYLQRSSLTQTNGTVSAPDSFMDRVLGRDLSFAALWIVTLQSIHTLMKRNQYSLFDEVRC